MRGNEGVVYPAKRLVALCHALCRDRNERQHAVVTAYAQQLGYGTYGVCGVGVAAVLLAGVLYPVLPCVGSAAGIVGRWHCEIVNVGSFAVRDGAQQTASVHLERGKGAEVVAAVFGHEAVPPRFLCRTHQQPALLNACGRRHLDGHVFAMPHGLHCYGAVAVPLRADVDQVDVGILTSQQLNDQWKNLSFVDETALAGGKATKFKIDFGSIIIPTSYLRKDLKKVEPFLKRRGVGENRQPMPNICEYIIKSRYGIYGDMRLKLWSYFDKGTFRRTDYFITDDQNLVVKINPTVLGDF